MSVPSKMRAVVCTGNKDDLFEVKEIPAPRLSDDEVLVRVSAIGLNPTDYKGPLTILGKDNIIGCDFAGRIEKLGDKVESESNLQAGDRVVGIYPGSSSKERGAFAEYAALEWHQLWRVPDNISDEEAVAIGGVPIETAAQALYIGEKGQTNRIDLPFPPEQTSGTILIWSGASAVGFSAIQLAKMSGLTVVTTASPKNHAALKAVGADYTYDYNDSHVTTKIKNAHDIDFAFDCFSAGTSTKQIHSIFGEKGGKIVSTLPQEHDGEGWNSKVTDEWTMVHTGSGKDIPAYPNGQLFKAAKTDLEGSKRWHQLLPELLKDGKIKPIKIRRCPGLLDSVHKGLYHVGQGKHSGEKLVYRVDQEFSPVPPEL